MNDTAAAEPFVPADFDPADYANIEPLGKDLLQRRIGSMDQLRRWFADLCRLFEVIDERGSRISIAHACHTEDEEKEAAYLRWVREIEPRLKPLFFAIQQRYLRNPQRHDLYEAGFAIMELHWQADVDVYRDANVPLQTKITELNKDYDKTVGAMTVDFKGETRTLQQMAVFLEETDRPTRQQAWELIANRRMQDREKIDAIFDQMLTLRTQIAANADCENFTQYMWKVKKRFDYTPADCLAFGESVEAVCVPLLEKVNDRRREALGVNRLRPWDMSVDPKGRPPLRPFDAKDIDGFVAGTREIFNCISPTLAEQFDLLKENGNLDLDSRRGKRPGGFQAALEDSKQPFIFMNAAGLHHDVETLLHEGGHAFHYLAARHEPNLFVRHAPLEFCEVASMSMELLACDYFNVFYKDAESAARAKRQQLEGSIRTLPWVATIDCFQHWLYAHPDHSRDQRTSAWLDLLNRFSDKTVDWSGYEAARQSMWQRQLHLFHVPFYYIEYGIAQLGALQIWLNYRNHPQKTLTQLLEAFALGGSRPLPELFATAGIRFDFSRATLEPLIAAVEAELAKLPE